MTVKHDIASCALETWKVNSMKTTTSSDVSEEKSIARELAKRRAFIVLFIVLIEIVGAFIGLEGDMLAHALNDYAILAISVVALVVIGAMWKKQSLAGLRKQHNILLILLIVALVFQIYAFAVEANDPTDLGLNGNQQVHLTSDHKSHDERGIV
jgi:membrane protease YdiL (CAAX protease family)